jgi:hypothetical protein
MKKIFTLLIGVVFSITIIYGQDAPPQAFSYKATINKANGQPLANTVISFRVSILQNNAYGTPVYIEKFSPYTNSLGQIDIQIGRGTPQLGNFPFIDWSLDTYFLKTEVDIKGGSNYVELSTTQLLSVPYALYAGSAGSVANLVETDPVFSVSPAANPTNIGNWNTAYGWGNHATAGYLTHFTETDPIFSIHPANGIISDNIANWNTAYGWGNHAGLYRPIGYVPTWSEVTGKPTFAAVATSGSYNDLINKPVQLTEADVENYIANDIITYYVPRDNGTKLVSGTIWDNGNFIGIGTTTLTDRLTVEGNIRASNNVAAGNDLIASGDVNGSNILTGGNVLAGGSIKGNNFIYNTVQTRYLNIPGGSCFYKTTPPNWTFTNYPFAGRLTPDGATYNEIFYAVDLPMGATIKGIQVYLMTQTSSTICDLTLGPGTGNGTIIATVTDAASDTWRWTPEVAVNHVVGNYIYAVRCTNDTPDDSNMIGGIRIRYEVSSPY